MQADALIREWAAQRELAESVSPTGRLTLLVDQRLRIHLMPGPNGQVAIDALVRELPAQRDERERIIEDAMRLSVGRMREDGATLAADDTGHELRLHAGVPAAAGEDALTEAVGRFANSLAFWRKALR